MVISEYCRDERIKWERGQVQNDEGEEQGDQLTQEVGIYVK